MAKSLPLWFVDNMTGLIKVLTSRVPGVPYWRLPFPWFLGGG